MTSHRKKKQHLYTLFTITLGLIVFLGLFLAFIIYANWPAIKSELGYLSRSNAVTITKTSPTPSPLITPEPIVEPAHLIIEKIGLDVPVQWDISVENTVEALNHGVAHLAGSARLGEIGNLFLSGHSSDYAWKNNPYAATFALLPKLVPGDKLVIKENGKTYVYQLTETKVVSPDQVEVANATTTPVLTLMTCYPVGSTRERYIVHAALISSPEKPTNQSASDNRTLPEIKFR